MTTILGVDCAAQDKKCGLAVGERTPAGDLRVLDVQSGLAAIVPVLTRWIDEYRPTLIAIDAPLGWPSPLGSELAEHRAGDPFGTTPDELFHRETDRVVRRHTGKRPMEVAADRIARAAHRAVRLLGELRDATGLEIPLAWTPAPRSSLGAIEVYPAVTILSRGLSDRGYKGAKDENRDRRRVLRDALGREIEDIAARDLLIDSDDAFDAVVCLLSASDFMGGNVLGPEDEERARQEGWIWFPRSEKG